MVSIIIVLKKRECMYLIKDENGESMRLVRRHEEAKQIIALREGWTMHRIKPQKKPTEELLNTFERAPF
jgi:hypothetical protein